MSVKGKGFYLVWTLLAFVVLVGAVTIFRSCVFPYPSYNNFVSRDKKYYAQVADACKVLLSQVNQPPSTWAMNEKADLEKGGTEWVIQGDDKSLPLVIREIHPTKVGVDIEKKSGNRVWIMVGISRPGYGISWQRNNYGNGLQRWELSVGGDGAGGILYSEP